MQLKMLDDNVYWVSHRTDPDGIIAHALGKRITHPQHFFVEHEDMQKTLESLLSKEQGRLIVSDMDLKDSQLEIIEQLARFHKLEWYDHHDGSRNNLHFLERHCTQVAVASNQCASELVQTTLLSDDVYAQTVAAIAHTHDFNMNTSRLWQSANEMQDIISSGFDLMELVRDISTGNLFTGGDPHSGIRVGYGGGIVSDYKCEKKLALSQLEQSIYLDEIRGVPVVFALSPSSLFMKPASQHLRNIFTEEVKMIVVLYNGRKNVIMSGRGQVGKYIPQFCMERGGGGRGHKGGYIVDHIVTPEIYPTDRTQIKKDFENYLICKA